MKTAAVDNALKGSDGNTLRSVHGHDNLSATRMTLLLMAAGLPDQTKVVTPQNARDFVGVKYRVFTAHETVSSTHLARLDAGIGDGSNQSFRASLALATASASVSPAEPQPGNSGKTADHLPVSSSGSTSSLSLKSSFTRNTIE